jgi:hypothetical protein
MNGQKAKLIKRKAKQYSNDIVKKFLDDILVMSFSNRFNLALKILFPKMNFKKIK